MDRDMYGFLLSHEHLDGSPYPSISAFKHHMAAQEQSKEEIWADFLACQGGKMPSIGTPKRTTCFLRWRLAYEIVKKLVRAGIPAKYRAKVQPRRVCQSWQVGMDGILGCYRIKKRQSGNLRISNIQRSSWSRCWIHQTNQQDLWIHRYNRYRYLSLLQMIETD